MRPHDPDPACSSFAPLLQPYIDGELDRSEHEPMAEHLAVCATCRATVQEQAEVRSALQGLPKAALPEGLRARVLLALDEVDREALAASKTRAAQRSSSRKFAWFGLRALYFAPVGALAVGLFALAREGLIVGSTPAGETQALRPPSPRPDPVGLATQGPPASDLESVLDRIEPEVGFAVQLAPRQVGGRGVHLIHAELRGAEQPGSTGLPPSRGATLQYRVKNAADLDVHLIDHQTPAHATAPQGSRRTIGGRDYFVDYDPWGRPIVRFVVGPVAHRVSLEPNHDDLTQPPRVSDADASLETLRHWVEAMGRNTQAARGPDTEPTELAEPSDTAPQPAKH